MVQITREEYNNALDIVEAYNRQFLNMLSIHSLKDLGSTHLKDWKDYDECSRRLKNALHYAFYSDNSFAVSIESLDVKILRKCPGVGNRTVKEFIEIRGY